MAKKKKEEKPKTIKYNGEECEIIGEGEHILILKTSKGEVYLSK